MIGKSICEKEMKKWEIVLLWILDVNIEWISSTNGQCEIDFL